MVAAIGSEKSVVNPASDSGSAIAALQKKLSGLQRKVQETSQDTSPGAKERLKLLQIQIQAIQTQIQQLQALAAQKAALHQVSHKPDKELAPFRFDIAGNLIDTTA